MLIDSYGRKIDYLRISVTDRCNLRCIYCMPNQGIQFKNQNQILSFEQISRIVSVAVGLGIRKVRITGGEPLVRKDLPLLIGQLKKIKGLEELCLTTNGTYLVEYAPLLKKAGLDRLNISLDSLIPEKFREITRGGNLEIVHRAIEIALAMGFSELKINTVLIKGFNTDEIPAFANLTQALPIQVRFIEYMPCNLDYFSYDNFFFSAGKAKEICSSLARLIALDDPKAHTAKVFKLEGFCGTIGFISPISQSFCWACNKLRLTSDGYLRSCLICSEAVNLKDAIDKEASEQDLAKLIKEAVTLKPKSHNLPDTALSLYTERFSMCQIGG